jgi:hypothetical protein
MNVLQVSLTFISPFLTFEHKIEERTKEEGKREKSRRNCLESESGNAPFRYYISGRHGVSERYGQS